MYIADMMVFSALRQSPAIFRCWTIDKLAIILAFVVINACLFDPARQP